MMVKMKRLVILVLLMLPLPLAAWENLCEGVSVDRSTYEFGDIQISDGPKTCVFTLRNDGAKDWLIERVSPSCGCTDATWTKGVVHPGEKAQIKAVYKNDDGPYPFDKSLTLKVSATEKPLFLHFRGICHDKPVPLSELYPKALGGGLAVKELEIKCGTLEQGRQRSECFMVANTSSKAVKLEFTDIPPQVHLQGLPTTIPAGKAVLVDFYVTADPNLWGKNWYRITPVADGKKLKSSLAIWTVTQINVSSLTREQKHAGSLPRFKSSTFDFGKKKSGERFEIVLPFKNAGPADLAIYKFDLDEGISNCRLVLSDGQEVSCAGISAIKPGESVTLKADVNTKGLPKGESLLTIRMVTNSPMRPTVDIFAAGWIE